MKEIIGYEGLYKVDEYGNVWSIPKKINCWNRFKYISYVRPGQFLKAGTTNCGYLSVILRKDGKSFNESIHRLMGYAYLNLSENPKLDINHKDGNKKNNNLSNLEVVTRSQNIRHSVKIGLSKFKKGDNHHSCKTKLFLKMPLEKDIERGITMKEACKKYDIKRTTFYSIRNKTHQWYKD